MDNDGVLGGCNWTERKSISSERTKMLCTPQSISFDEERRESCCDY